MKSEKNPITQEAVERWQQGKINIFDEMARMEDEINFLKMHNHIIKVANEDLAIMVKRTEETLYNIWQCFEIKNELYMSDEDGFYASAHKARLCLRDIGSELIKEALDK
jgi:hypothetical protein